MVKGWKLESTRHSLASKGVKTNNDIVYTTPKQLSEYYLKASPEIHSEVGLDEYYKGQKLAEELAIKNLGHTPHWATKINDTVYLEMKHKDFVEAEYLYLQKKFPKLNFTIDGKTIIGKNR